MRISLFVLLGSALLPIFAHADAVNGIEKALEALKSKEAAVRNLAWGALDYELSRADLLPPELIEKIEASALEENKVPSLTVLVTLYRRHSDARETRLTTEPEGDSELVAFRAAFIADWSLSRPAARLSQADEALSIPIEILRGEVDAKRVEKGLADKKYRALTAISLLRLEEARTERLPKPLWREATTVLSECVKPADKAPAIAYIVASACRKTVAQERKRTLVNASSARIIHGDAIDNGPFTEVVRKPAVLFEGRPHFITLKKSTRWFAVEPVSGISDLECDIGCDGKQPIAVEPGTGWLVFALPLKPNRAASRVAFTGTPKNRWTGYIEIKKLVEIGEDNVRDWGEVHPLEVGRPSSAEKHGLLAYIASLDQALAADGWLFQRDKHLDIELAALLSLIRFGLLKELGLENLGDQASTPAAPWKERQRFLGGALTQIAGQVFDTFNGELERQFVFLETTFRALGALSTDVRTALKSFATLREEDAVEVLDKALEALDGEKPKASVAAEHLETSLKGASDRLGKITSNTLERLRLTCTAMERIQFGSHKWGDHKLNQKCHAIFPPPMERTKNK